MKRRCLLWLLFALSSSVSARPDTGKQANEHISKYGITAMSTKATDIHENRTKLLVKNTETTTSDAFGFLEKHPYDKPEALVVPGLLGRTVTLTCPYIGHRRGQMSNSLWWKVIEHKDGHTSTHIKVSSFVVKSLYVYSMSTMFKYLFPDTSVWKI